MAQDAVTATSGDHHPFDVDKVRGDFPIFAQKEHDAPLIYLDSAASAQKPTSVSAAMRRAYEAEYANVHRGLYALATTATGRYEDAREKARAFINAASTREVVFTRGATEGLNLVANAYGRHRLVEGDEIIVTAMEHHSNIVPWQMLRDEKNLKLKVAPLSSDGSLDMNAFRSMLTERVKLVAVAHVSNVLGTVLPIERIAALARSVGAVTVVDGAQGAAHRPVDVAAMGADFYAFTGHKLYGPTGIGVLWGREALFEDMSPWMGGGDMISSVSFEASKWAELPAKFEAGTPPIVQAIGLGAAIDYLSRFDSQAVARHERDLLAYATGQLSDIDGVSIQGTTPDKAGIVSFSVVDIHPHDVAMVLDSQGVCVRAGHHCAQPLMTSLGLAATVRASFGIYNTRADVDALADGVRLAKSVLG